MPQDPLSELFPPVKEIIGRAHNEAYRAREACHDDVMRDHLRKALIQLRKAQRRLREIEAEVRRSIP